MYMAALVTSQNNTEVRLTLNFTLSKLLLYIHLFIKSNKSTTCLFIAVFIVCVMFCLLRFQVLVV